MISFVWCKYKDMYFFFLNYRKEKKRKRIFHQKLNPFILLFSFTLPLGLSNNEELNYFLHGNLLEASNIKGPTPWKSNMGGWTRAGPGLTGGLGGRIGFNKAPDFPPLKFVGTLQMGFVDFTKYTLHL